MVASHLIRNMIANVFWHQSVLTQTFFLVGSAEIFDKTFFIAMILAMQHRKFGVTVFLSCFVALVLHVAMAAVCGYAISKMLTPMMLDFGAAGLYFIFACLYAKDYYYADPEALCDLDETKAELAEMEGGSQYGAASGPKKILSQAVMKVATLAFTSTFIGEFGDRTQIAMIGQHASQPIIPVCIGSTLAFAVLCATAVLSGIYLSSCAVTERQVCMIGGFSFLIFSVVSLWDGMHTLQYRDPVKGLFLQIM